jgi:predicted alpha/beta superfamily hydrolase
LKDRIIFSFLYVMGNETLLGLKQLTGEMRIMRHRTLSALLVCFLLCLSVLVQENMALAEQLSSEDYIFGLHIKIDSKVLGESKDVYIHLPNSYQDGKNLYPVLYVLDGGDYFEPFAGMVKYLSIFELIPEMIVVAVAHGDRLKEFTFTKANEKTGDWPTSGGAESFRRFLADELVPHIDLYYRTHPFRILVGHSLGGLFAVETLSRTPDLFQATIALSPSLYWNQFEWLKTAENFLDKHNSLKHFLFISGEPKDEEETSYLNKFKDLVKIKAPKGFSYEYRCFPEEDHGSVAIPGLFANLKQLFEGWRFPGEAWETGPEKVAEHFQNLSDRFGFSVPITEEFLNGHAFHGLQRHDAPDEAIELFEFCLSLYPNSAEAYEGLGESYAKKGVKDKAREYYEKSLEIDPENVSARQKLEELDKI